MTVLLLLLWGMGIGYLVLSLQPRIRRLRQAMRGPGVSDAERVAAQNQFVRLQRQSVRIRAAVFLLGIGLLAWVLLIGLLP